MDRPLALLLFLPLIPAFHWIGRRLLPAGRSAILHLSLGTWALAPPLFVLGACGALTAPAALALYLSLALAGVPHAPAALRAIWRDLRLPIRQCLRHARWSGAALAALLILQVIDGTAYPLGGDQLGYHFPLARRMAETGGLEPLYGLPPSCILPQNVHLYYAFGMLVHSDILGKLFVTFWGLLSLGLCHSLGRALFGPRVGLLGLLVLAFTPWTAYMMHFPFVEVPLAHAALTAALLFLSHLRTGAPRPLIAAGCMVGIALGIKQTAWALVPLLAVAGILAGRHLARRAPAPAPVATPRGGRVRLRPLLVALSAAALLGSPWYLRNLYYLGNPFWPLFGFGSPLPVQFWSPGYGENATGALRPALFLGFLKSLFLNYGKDCFSFFSPFLIICAPLLPALARRSLAARSLLAMALLGLAFSYAMAPFSARYWYPFFALLCPVLGLAIATARRAPFLATVHRAALLLVGVGVVGHQAVSTALLHRFPDRSSLYASLPEGPMAGWIRRNIPPGDRVIYPYENAYIFPGNVTPIWYNQAWIDFVRDCEPEALAARLGELGARYLVYAGERNAGNGIYGEALALTVDGMLSRRIARPAAVCGDLVLLEVGPPGPPDRMGSEADM